MFRICFLILTLLTAVPVTSKVVEDLRYSSYDVPYHYRVPLKVLVARATPMHASERMIVVGWTVPRITWKARLQTLPNTRCQVQSLTTSLSVIITLPASKDTEISQDGDFRVFLTRLKNHELGHYAIAKTAAFQIEIGRAHV